ncbi:intracellular hyaluronan-binding protein 4 isoform X3 [Falco naumanni]|uniref:intracellular hyaluronan-binding protein 4 isoform X3 n=1 Tax=Falco naumanni TaxID=148594 RepID=UPI001ADDEFD3|nr:intracellular hyaluronan-binding protein 4 isoform X3 [Falco naumanni]
MIRPCAAAALPAAATAPGAGARRVSGEPSAAMMKRVVGSPVTAVMQESFSCAITNRFCHLLDDQSDPLDILRAAELRQRPDPGSGPGGKAGCGKRESQKERRELGPALVRRGPPQPGQKQASKQGVQQGFNHGGAQVKQNKPEWRPSFREYHSYETERDAEFLMERQIKRSDCERPIRGRGRGRGGMQGRGRGGRISRCFDGFDQRGRLELERQSGNGKVRMKADDKKSGGEACNWGTVKNDTSGMEQTSVEETAETAQPPGASEGQHLNKVAEGEPMEEVVQEMTLDEWKKLQQQNRPKPEFNIRKPESTVPSKAVVIHKSKYRDDLQKGNFEDDSHVFRRPVNDITSQLDINFGSLPRPGRGLRGARGDRVYGRQLEESGRQPNVGVQLVAPNPDDPEDFPALA